MIWVAQRLTPILTEKRQYAAQPAMFDDMRELGKLGDVFIAWAGGGACYHYLLTAEGPVRNKIVRSMRGRGPVAST